MHVINSSNDQQNRSESRFKWCFHSKNEPFCGSPVYVNNNNANMLSPPVLKQMWKHCFTQDAPVSLVSVGITWREYSVLYQCQQQMVVLITLVTCPSLMWITSDAFRFLLYFLPWPGSRFSILHLEQAAIGWWMCILTHIEMQPGVCASDTAPEDEVITLTAHLRRPYNSVGIDRAARCVASSRKAGQCWSWTHRLLQQLDTSHAVDGVVVDTWWVSD